MHDILPLPQYKYEGYTVEFAYESDIYYDVRIRDTHQGFAVDFVRMPFPATKQKHSTDHLYGKQWMLPEAYGIFEGETPIAILEVATEQWNSRLRVTNLWVAEAHRRQGMGAALLEKAKRLMSARGHRCIALEVQSCNAGAIAFYIQQGFMLAGFDAFAYSNEDVEKKEVRIEMVYRPSRVAQY